MKRKLAFFFLAPLMLSGCKTNIIPSISEISQYEVVQAVGIRPRAGGPAAS
jgi:hypothetical protein